MYSYFSTDVPLIGILQQFRLADKFVFYDDVQFTRGFFNRVQIPYKQGQEWMTVPLLGEKEIKILIKF